MAQHRLTMRPEGIRGCPGGDHPVLLLREVGGSRRVTLRVDEGEARRLAGEFEGIRGRWSRTYETLERVIAGLGGTVAGLRLVAGPEGGLSGEIEVATDGRQACVPAHPGDVVALARRLDLPVHVPAQVAHVPQKELGPWRPPVAVEPMAGRAAGFGRGPEPNPEDYDW